MSERESSDNPSLAVESNTAISADRATKTLRQRAGGIISRIMPKRHATDAAIGKRQKQQRKAGTCSNELPAKQSQDGTSKTLDPSLPGSGHISVSCDTLKQIALALQSHDDLVEAEYLKQAGYVDLNDVRTRLRMIQENSTDMKTWFTDNTIRLLEESEDPETKEVEIKEALSFYDDLYTFLEEALEDVRKQCSHLDEALKKVVDDGNNIRKLASEKVLHLLELETAPTLLSRDQFEVNSPVDASYLEEREQIWNNFAAEHLTSAPISVDEHHLRPGSSWSERYAELKQARNTFNIAISELSKLENTPGSDRGDGTATVDELRDIVWRATVALRNAIHRARGADLQRRSTGSLVFTRDESDTGEAERNPDQMYRDFPGHEMTPEEIQEYVERNRRETEKWLTGSMTDRDLEKPEPVKPGSV